MNFHFYKVWQSQFAVAYEQSFETCKTFLTLWVRISLCFVADEDSNMQAACDDECDTLAEKEELVTLASMGQNSETSNHGPEQVLLSQALRIQLDYIQAKHHQNLFLPTHVFDDIFHVQNHSKPSPRCTLLSTHLHKS